MKETLTLNCTRTFFGSPYDALRILPICFIIIVFWKKIFPNISLDDSMGLFIFVILCIIFMLFINKIVFFLYKKTIIETINISSTGIEFIQPKINQQSLFLWSNIQSIKYIYHYSGHGVYYHEKISIKTKDNQSKTFIFELDKENKKRQEYDRLHEKIYQILKQYTVKHQICYKHNHTDDSKFANSPLGENTLLIAEVITLLLLTILVATIIILIMISEIDFSKIKFDILLAIIPIFILWFVNIFLVVKGIKRLLK